MFESVVEYTLIYVKNGYSSMSTRGKYMNIYIKDEYMFFADFHLKSYHLIVISLSVTEFNDTKNTNITISILFCWECSFFHHPNIFPNIRSTISILLNIFHIQKPIVHIQF